MTELEDQIKKEAEKVFKHLAIDYLTKNVPEFDISQTYSIENCDVDPLSLVSGIGNVHRYPSYLQPIFSPDTGEILTFEERWIDDENHEAMLKHQCLSEEHLTSNRGFDEEVEKIFRFSNKEEAKHEEEGQYLDFSTILNTPPGFSGSVDVSGVSHKEETITNDLSKSEVDSVELAQPQKLDMPTIDLESADIFDILNMVMDQPIRSVNENLDTGGGIIRPQHMTSTNQDSTVESSLSLEETGKLEETIASNLTTSTDAPSQEITEKKKKLKVKEHDYMFAQMLNVNEKVTKYHEILPVMAKKYPFDLDPFQQHAVVSMEEGNSVFVAAHTSAGKTVVAEYAIALCKIHRTRVIYTSPIKALSNQKFRDFKMAFEDVGLVTGDIQLHTDAFCLIMTTEILRSMLYNGSEVIRELEWVIFDEVHYVNDSERGHVWEEVLIMLPAHVKIVMLSATVPNCMEFADWVGRIKNRKINVIQTLKRPVPLEHYLYTGQDGKTRKDLFKIMDKDGEFLSWGCKKAVEAKKNSTKGKSAPNRHYAGHNCIDRLKGSDRQLPQVLLMQEHCKRGFAVHHSGILPIIKEVVELLFQRGYVKILFATETFAMGVNMPARTVAFDTLEKFDGNSRRFLNATEYVQMAGRAGRRGLDSTGTVIVLCKGLEPPDVLCLTNMLKGKAVSLESKFRITYPMILNLMRVEQLRIEDMLQRSFVERTSLRLVVSRKEKMEELKDELLETPDVNCTTCMPTGNSSSASIMTYYQTLRHYIHEMPSVWADLVANYDVMKVFAPGRVLLINHPPLGLVGVLAVLLQAKHSGTGKFLLTVMVSVNEQFVNEVPEKFNVYGRLSKEEVRWRRETLIMEHIACCGLEGMARPTTSNNSYYLLEDLELDCIMAVLKQQVKSVDVNAITTDFEGRKKVFRSYSPDRMVRRVITELNSLTEKWSAVSPTGTELPVYVLGEDIVKNGVDIFKRLRVVKELRFQLTDPNAFHCRFCVYFVEHLRILMKRIRLEESLEELVYQTSSDGLLMSADYMGRLKVLQELDYVDKSNMVGLKGKVACEINNQELLITELMLENKFENKSCAEIAAMLSPLTCQSATTKSSFKANGEGEVSRAPAAVLEQLKKDVTDVANKIDRVQQSHNVHTLVLDELMFDLMETIYQWANGMPFSEIMKLTDTQEGIIVRCIQRLDEVLKDVRNAARIVGNPALYEKMEETSATIKRDIVFAASLYTTE
uniref:Helicase SKI2W n=1 Tax=Ditylenchus dipsaci TaxID=166011 RepID=A0A915D9W4_9BILA